MKLRRNGNGQESFASVLREEDQESAAVERFCETNGFQERSERSRVGEMS